MKARKISVILMAAILAGSFSMTGCGQSASAAGEEVIIYSNADDEAVEAMKKTLDENGYEGQYLFQTFGTSELGGKVMAEGTDIEADPITLSTFYIDAAQEDQNMFQPLEFDYTLLNSADQKDYCAPITSQEGTIIVNTEVLSGIYENAGPHIETSGSAPLKKVRAGEVAVGFGLRQQAVADKAEGLPIDFVDPTEGNFSLTESVAVVDKGEDTNPLAQKMAECIITQGRSELQQYYPNAVYEGETTDEANSSAYPKVFPEPLTLDLLEKHQELSESCK